MAPAPVKNGGGHDSPNPVNPADPIAGPSSGQRIGGDGQGYGSGQAYGDQQRVPPGGKSEDPVATVEDAAAPGGPPEKGPQAPRATPDNQLPTADADKIKYLQGKGEGAIRDAEQSAENPPPEGDLTWSADTYKAKLENGKMIPISREADVPQLTPGPEGFIEDITGTPVPWESADGAGSHEYSVWGKRKLLDEGSEETVFSTYIYSNEAATETIVYWPRGYKTGTESDPFYDAPAADRVGMTHHMNQALEKAGAQNVKWLINAEVTNPTTREIMHRMSTDSKMPSIHDDGDTAMQMIVSRDDGTAPYFYQLVGSPVGSPWPYTMKDYPARFGGNVPVKAYVWYNPAGNAPERFIIWELGSPAATN